MTTTKKQASGSPLKPASEVAIDDSGLARFTWNCRGGNESLTIRCDDEEELKVLRDKWKQVISPPRRKLPYMHSGDECLVENCTGVMQIRTGTNRKTQQAYQFLRCSNNPKCNFTAYIETEENTPDDALISPVAARANGKGVADVAAG
jgi:ssDNA-binding Zn-finger/Zn-ribbon topoisomerase 1